MTAIIKQPNEINAITSAIIQNNNYGDCYSEELHNAKTERKAGERPLQYLKDDPNVYEEFIYLMPCKNKDGEDDTKEVYSPTMASNVAEGIFYPVTFNETLYIYNCDTGLYSEDNGTVASWISNILRDATLIKANVFSPTQGIKEKVKEVVLQVSRSNNISSKYSPFNQYTGIPFNNGVLVFDAENNPKLVRYNHSMRFNRKLKINYNPDANTVRIIEILKEWGGDEWEYLIQMAAQAIYQSLPGKSPLKSAYLLTGERDAGKSTYLELLERVFGEENISQVQLQKLGDRFSLGGLIDKYLNVGDDLPDVNLNTSNNLKEVTGKRCQNVELKHKQSFNADITAVQIHTCNKPPQVNDALNSDNAWWSRWIIIEFLNSFDRVEGWKANNFTQENLEGFGLLMIDEFKYINARRGEINTQAIEDVQDKWLSHSSPLKEFLDENTEPEPGDMSKDKKRLHGIPKQMLFDALRDWINQKSDTMEKIAAQKRTPNTINALTTALINLGIRSKQSRDPEHKGKFVQIYEGIIFKSDSPYKLQTTENSHL